MNKYLLLILLSFGALFGGSVSAATCPTDNGSGYSCSGSAPYWCGGSCKAVGDTPGFSQCTNYTVNSCASGVTCTNVTATDCGYISACNTSVSTLCGSWPNATCKTNVAVPSNCNNYNQCTNTCNGCSSGYLLCSGACVQNTCQSWQTASCNGASVSCADSTATVSLGSDSVLSDRLKNSSNPLFTILSSGNVGIGTTTPNATLKIVGSNQVINVSGGRIGGLDLMPLTNDEAVPLGYLKANYSSTSSSLWGGAKNGNIWNGDSGAGNVGIGTNNPRAKLEVAANDGISASIVAGNIIEVAGLSEVAQAADVTISAGTLVSGGPTAKNGKGYWDITSFPATITFNTRGWWTYAGLSFTAANVHNYPNGGGNKLPANFLVEASADGTNWVTVENVTGYTSALYYKNNVYSGSGKWIRITATAPQSGETTAKLANVQIFNGQRSGKGPFSLSAEGHAVFIGGNVGIGTTLPTQTLDVQGDIELGVNNFLLKGVDTGNPYLDISVGDTASGGSYGRGIILRRGRTGTGATNWANIGLVNDSTLGFGVGNGVGGSATNLMVLNSSGYLGIGTNNPLSKLTVVGSNGSTIRINKPAAMVDNGDVIGLGTGVSNGLIFAPSALANGNNGYFKFSFPDNNKIRFNTDYDGNLTGGIIRDIEFGDNSAVRMVIKGSGSYLGNIGIGTTTPTGILSLNTGVNALNFSKLDPALWNYNATQYLRFDDLSIYSLNVLGGLRSTAGNLYIDGTGTSYIMGNTGIGTTGPSGRLTVVGSAGASRSVTIDSREIKFRGDGVAHMSIFGPDTGKGYITIQNTSTNTIPGITGSDLITILASGSIGINTTTPGYKLDVQGGQINASGGLCMGGVCKASWTEVGMSGSMTTDLNMGNHNILGVNKLTVATIDPLYQINGIKYSTFAASVAGGVKEEYIGRVYVNSFNKKDKYYEKVIDFDKESVGSDLWVWYHTVDFSSDNVEVFLSSRNNFVQSYSDIQGSKIYIRTDKPAEISLRLVGKRFDWKEWPTKAVDQSEPASLIIN